MKKILLAADGSEHSLKTVNKAIALADPEETEITVLSVMDEDPSMPYAVPQDIRDKVKKEKESFHQETVENVKDELEKHGLKVKTMVKQGHPAHVICDVAESEGYDLIILGSKGLGKIQEFLLGSVSNRVVHCATTNVMIVK